MILVVSNDAGLTEQVERIASDPDLQCQVRCVSSGRLGIARTKGAPPDVVVVSATITDVSLSEFCAEFRSDRNRSGAPIVAAIDRSSDSDERAALLEAGVDDILLLPVSDDELRAKARLLLRLKEADDRVRASRARIRALASEQAAILRQTEDRFRALAQYSSEGVVVVSDDGRMKFMTPTMERILGWTSSEAESLCIWEIVHRSDRRRLQEAWEALLRNPMAATVVEARVRTKRSGWLWLEVVASNQLHVPGVHGVVLNCRDISERRRISDALRASQSRYRMFVEVTQEGIWATDAAERTTFVNERMAQMLGYTTPEMLGKPVASLLLPEDREEHTRRIARRAGGQMEAYEQRFVRKDGSILWALVSASPMLDQTDQYSGSFALLTDITEQKQMDRELREALARFETLIEATPLVAIQGMDRDGTITLWNRASESLYGVPRDEAVGRRLQDILLDDEEAAAFEQVLGEIWASGQPTAPYEWRVCTPGGLRRWVYSTMVPVKTDDAVSCVYCMDVDVTDRNEARAALLESQQELERLNAELGRRVEERTKDLQEAVEDLDSFAYSVTHDLRAPLRAVSGFSKALDEDYGQQLEGDGARYIRLIRDSVARMDKLISDLLTFSRCSRTDMTLRNLSLTDLVKSALEDMDHEQLARSEIVMGDLPTVCGDHALLRQVLTNLLANALKYSRTQEHPRIEITATDDGSGWVRCAVKDNGVGYDNRYAHKLFGVFQRLHNESEFEGTGVGLAIVHRIIRRHGGQVGSESELGKGATFWFTVPRGV